MNRKLFFILFLNLLLMASNVYANMAKPPEPIPGNVAGNSYLKKMSVLKEDLTIDMSEIHLGKPVKVRAQYKVEATEDLSDVELIFIANNLTESRYKVEIDGQFTNGYITAFDPLPESWLPPDSIRWGKEKIPYLYTSEGLISFKIDRLSKGIHTITVDYDANISQWFTYKQQTIINTFVYILKPTEEWKSFNDFKLTVFIPAGWECSNNLNLREINSGEYSRAWSYLPESFLSIAVQKNSDAAIWYSRLFRAGSWIIFFLVALWWIRVVSRFRIRKKIHWTIVAFHLLAISFIATVVFYLIYYYDKDLTEYYLENQKNPLTDFGSGYFILAFPVIWLFSLVIFFLLDRIILKKVKKAQHNCEEHG